MNISSRIPDGRFNHCPICDQHIQIEPSEPAGDAPCPHCGVLLWFVETEHGLAFFDQPHMLQAVSKLSYLRDGSELPDFSTCEVEFFEFEVGARVVISGGVFQSSKGTIEKLDLGVGKAIVRIQSSDCETPVEVNIRHLGPA